MLERFGAAWRALRGANLPAIRNDGFGLQDLDKMLEIFNITPTASGQQVNSKTALRVAAVYACYRLIVGTLSTLPLPVYRSTDDVPERQPDHPLTWLLNSEPTPLMPAAMFWDYTLGSKLMRGDGIAHIVRDKALNVTEIIPMDSNFTFIERRENELVYWYQDNYAPGGARRYGLTQDEVLHFPGFGWDPLRFGAGWLKGMSVIGNAAFQATGNALAMDDYSGRFFANGADPSMTIEVPGKMDEEQLGRFRTMLKARTAGAAMRTPLILTEGVKANPMSVTAVDAQLNEARLYTVADIARAFGVPPVMIGEQSKTSAWGTGIEQLAIGFVKYCLQPHLTQIEQEINRKCFKISRYYVEFNVNGLMRGDSKARAEYYRAALGGAQGPGWMTQNEVRRFENLPKDVDPKSSKLFISATPAAAAQPGADNAQPAA
jgi:HK97 family phage portal protein